LLKIGSIDVVFILPEWYHFEKKKNIAMVMAGSSNFPGTIHIKKRLELNNVVGWTGNNTYQKQIVVGGPSPIPNFMRCTLPETNSLPLKIGRAPKGNKKVFQPSIFRGYKIRDSGNGVKPFKPAICRRNRYLKSLYLEKCISKLIYLNSLMVLDIMKLLIIVPFTLFETCF